jgi:hypothetical protein
LYIEKAGQELEHQPHKNDAASQHWLSRRKKTEMFLPVYDQRQVVGGENKV